MSPRLVAIAVLSIACKKDPAGSAGACDAVVTAADVANACGASAVIEATLTEGTTSPLRDKQLVHVCDRDIVIGGDRDRHIVFTANRVTPAEPAAKRVAEARRMLSNLPLRDVDGQAFLVTTKNATKELFGASGSLTYKLIASGRDDQWACSEDGLVELGRLIKPRISSLEP